MRRKLNKGADGKRTRTVIGGPRILPVNKSPNSMLSISTTDPLSLPVTPFLHLVVNKKNGGVRTAAYRNGGTLGRYRRPHQPQASCPSMPPAVPGSRRIQSLSRPRQPRLIFNRTSRTSPDVEVTEGKEVDIFLLETVAGQIFRSRLEGRRQRQGYDQNFHWVRDAQLHIDTELALYEDEEAPVIPQQSGAAAIQKLPVDERTCRICYYDYGTRSEVGIVETPLQLLQCSHVFGDRCIEKWIKLSNTCPYCRKQMSVQQ